MKSLEVRKAFLDFFASRGHDVVRSSSLIPRHDPTLLFTNAGMVQFKSVFLGEETRPYIRAATSQKCMRAGGKHSDIENVGHTARHHTFFEMLGNFSFGDYFKADAIRFAWELLTEVYKLPKDKLWATVYEDDDEAERLWQENSDIPKERIVRLGAKDNFWQMAETGPCGPCSEIIIDQGEGMGCGQPHCKVGCDCDRYLELWNLVFMQYDRDETGRLNPLPKPSIDTGMGLERICSVLQGKRSNFDTDLFDELRASISSLTGVQYGRSHDSDVSIRVIADHLRASTFLISDGLMPANDGRGYVLRRIIRRASRHARLLGTTEPMLYKAMSAVVSTMGGIYPELKTESERASRVIKIEEERFGRTLEHGLKILDELIENMRKSGEKTIPGAEVFKLYDTFGFPLDLARDIALDTGLQLDEQGFQSAMDSQKERARASWVGVESAVSAIYKTLHSELGDTEFLGYDAHEADAVIRAILKSGSVVDTAGAGDEVEVFLDRTPFYGESGGQSGDHGSISAPGVRLDVTDAKKRYEGCISHLAKVQDGSIKVGMSVYCRIDEARRHATMRNHTATHLLQAALRLVLGDHVKQAGSLVEPERMRFDFTHFAGLTGQEMQAVEDMVNEKVIENLGVSTSVQDIAAAQAGGAMALFGEKYGESVRVVSVGDFSKELCGGTHCTATGEIGPFLIASEGSVASGVRRIEAVTGGYAYEKLKQERAELAGISALLKGATHPAQKIKDMLDELKVIQKEQEKVRGAAFQDMSGEIVQGARDIDGVKVVSFRRDGIEQKELRELADKVRDRLGSGVVVLASATEGQASLLALVTKDLVPGCDAGAILKAVAASSGGSGGGKPNMAQGGTKNLEKLDSALNSVYDIVKQQIKKSS